MLVVCEVFGGGFLTERIELISKSEIDEKYAGSVRGGGGPLRRGRRRPAFDLAIGPIVRGGGDRMMRMTPFALASAAY